MQISVYPLKILYHFFWNMETFFFNKGIISVYFTKKTNKYVFYLKKMLNSGGKTMYYITMLKKHGRR